VELNEYKKEEAKRRRNHIKAREHSAYIFKHEGGGKRENREIFEENSENVSLLSSILGSMFFFSAHTYETLLRVEECDFPARA
jgi:hypothetical protein